MSSFMGHVCDSLRSSLIWPCYLFSGWPVLSFVQVNCRADGMNKWSIVHENCGGKGQSGWLDKTLDGAHNSISLIVISDEFNCLVPQIVSCLVTKNSFRIADLSAESIAIQQHMLDIVKLKLMAWNMLSVPYNFIYKRRAQRHNRQKVSSPIRRGISHYFKYCLML